MMEDDIELICPCCNAILGVDETGDLFLLEEPPLEPGVSRGLGGLTVVDADPRWRETNYRFNQQGSEDQGLIEFGFPALKLETDPLIEAAVEKDLKTKGIK